MEGWLAFLENGKERSITCGLPLVVVIIITAGALTEGLFLFLNLLPLLAVDGMSAADEVVSAGLDHAC